MPAALERMATMAYVRGLAPKKGMVVTQDGESDAAQSFMDRLLNLGDVHRRCGEGRSRDGACGQAST